MTGAAGAGAAGIAGGGARAEVSTVAGDAWSGGCARAAARPAPRPDPKPTSASTLAASSARRRSLASSTGTRQRKASSAPVTGETGAQRSETTPSAVQAGSRGALTARASHSRTRPAWPCCSPSMRAISVATRCVRRPSSSGSSALRASSHSRASMARDGERDRPLAIVRREAREVAHAVETVARAVAGPGVGIGGGEIGMRRKPPGLEQHARGARRVALRGQDAAGDGRGRHQVGRQPMRLAAPARAPCRRRILRAPAPGPSAARRGGGWRRALSIRLLAPRDRQRIERALPVARRGTADRTAPRPARRAWG